MEEKGKYHWFLVEKQNASSGTKVPVEKTSLGHMQIKDACTSVQTDQGLPSPFTESFDTAECYFFLILLSPLQSGDP